MEMNSVNLRGRYSLEQLYVDGGIALSGTSGSEVPSQGQDACN